MKTKRPPKTDERIRMYFRVHPKTRDLFRAVASLHGETMEFRAEQLLADDIRTHLPEHAPASTPAAAR